MPPRLRRARRGCARWTGQIRLRISDDNTNEGLTAVAFPPNLAALHRQARGQLQFAWRVSCPEPGLSVTALSQPTRKNGAVHGWTPTVVGTRYPQLAATNNAKDPDTREHLLAPIGGLEIRTVSVRVRPGALMISQFSGVF